MENAPINHAMAVRCSSDYLTKQVQNLVSLGHFKSKPVAHTQDLTSSISVAVRLDNCSNIYIYIYTYNSVSVLHFNFVCRIVKLQC